MPYAPDSYPRQIPQFKVHGRGEVTVSAKGIVTGDSNIPNDGADFGPDTMLGATAPGQYGPPYTQTFGWNESVKYSQYAGIIKFKEGFSSTGQITYPVSPNGLYGSYITYGPGLSSFVDASGSALDGLDFITLPSNSNPGSEYAFLDFGIQDITTSGVNSMINQAGGTLWLSRFYFYGHSKYHIYIASGESHIDGGLFNNWTSAAIYLDTPSGGPFWFTNLQFGIGMTSALPCIYIANGLAGGYIAQGCGFTGSTIGIQVEGQTTDLLVTMCEFAGSTGLILNAIINTSAIIGNSFNTTTQITFGSSFYPNNLRIQNNPGLNPFGLLATPFTTTVPSGGSPWMGPGTPSGTAAPLASTSYRVEVCDQIVTSTGGTSVSITIKDAAGNTLLSGASTLTNYYLAAGWSIDFGAFTAAPTVTVIGL